MPQDEQTLLEYRNLCVDLLTQSVTVQGQPVHLAKIEYRLLCYLIQHAGQVVSRQEILANIWKLPPNARTRTLDMHIHALRKKLGLNDDLETVFRIGYKLRQQSKKED